MPQRLSALEVSMLALDTAHHPGHVGTVDIFQPPAAGEFDYEQLISLIRQRIAFVPRYRMRVRVVPGGLAAPIWVEDERFDLTFHVRQSALPRPGTMQQLREFVGRVMARRLDRTRPLWETYLVEGLQGGRFALVTKSHQSLVDGIDTVEIGQVLLGPDRDVRPVATEAWQPLPEPSPLDLVSGALIEAVQDPGQALNQARNGLTGLLGVAITIGETVGGLGAALGDIAGNALRGGRAPADSPLSGMVSQQRRFATLSVTLAELKQARGNDDQTVNDVILAVITGGLRNWLLTRGEEFSSRSLSAVVPMSVREDDGEPTALGSQVAPHLVDLPIGEPNPLMRLHQVSYANRAHMNSGRAVDARTISDIAGFAPTTLHALGVRVAQETLRKQHDLVITNVPGPQVRLYAAGAPLMASYPVLPLGTGHLLAIGVTSYDGEVFFGLTGDRDSVSDLDVLAQCIADALEEITLAVRRPVAARRAPRVAKVPAAAKTPAAQKARAGKKAPAKKAPAKESASVEQAPAKKAPVKKAPAKKAPAKKAPAKKAPVKKAPAKKGAPASVTEPAQLPPGSSASRALAGARRAAGTHPQEGDAG